MKHALLWTLALALAACGCGRREGGTPAPRHFAIRSLGDVAVSFREAGEGEWETRYACESPEAARILASKRRADLLAFGGLREEADGAIVLDGVGAWRISLDGTSAVERFDSQWRPSPTSLAPVGKAAHPAWMDGFDRWGAALWIGGGGAPMDIPGDFEWLQRLGLGACVALPGGEEDCFAPGEMDWAQYDWYEAMARKYGFAFRMLTHVGRFPWCWNTDPLPHVFPGDPRYVGLPAFYYIDVLTSGSMNAGVPGVAGDRYRFDARRRLAERFHRPDSPLLGWHVCEELTCGTLNWLATCARTPAVVEAWRAYARDTLGVAGDPGPVPVPEDFLPRDHEHDIDLFGTWEISTDVERWTPGPCNDPILLAFSRSWHVRPPDRYEDVWLRRAFDVPEGGVDAARYLHLASAAYKTVYGAPPDVTVNGVACERLPGDFSRCYDLGPALREGRNEILVNAHGSCLPGYVYLTSRPLALYPDMGEALNRRWYDAVNFGSHLRVKYIEDRIRAVRAADPVRPLKMMAVKEAQDEALGLCRRYGAYFHDTGGAGGYWCPYSGARLSKAHGLPWSCEQGGPPQTAERMRAAVSRYLQYGNDAVDFVFAIAHYRSVPEVAAWCETNALLLRAIGQLRLPTPRVAVLRSSRVYRLGKELSRDVETRDVGRGLLQAMGREFVYLEVPDLHDAAFIDRFPVVVDCATAVMEERDAAAIRRYVDAGGTFVAMPTTGRHLPARKDANPLDAAFADAPPETAARFVRLDKWPSMKDVGGAYVEAQSEEPRRQDGAPSLPEILENAAGGPDWESTYPRLWASPRESKNGVFDAILVTRMENPGEGVAPEITASATVRLPLERGRPARGGSLGELAPPSAGNSAQPWGHGLPARDGAGGSLGELAPSSAGNSARPWGHGLPARDGASVRAYSLPPRAYMPMETSLTLIPKPDPQCAGLRWIEALAEIWHPVEAVPASAAPVVEPSPDVVVLRDGWTPCTPGFFGAIGMPEDSHVTFRVTAQVPQEWLDAGDGVDLRMHCGFVMRGLSPYGSVTVNGQGVPGYSPFKTFRQGGQFSFDATGLARENGGRLEIAVEIDGSKTAEEPEKFSGRPNGAGATFALHRRRAAKQRLPLGPWRACMDYGDTTPAAPGEKPPHRWFETAFETPAATSGDQVGASSPSEPPRVFLAADRPLRGIMVNGRTVNVPDLFRELDITGLLLPAPATNVLRWCDGDLHGFSSSSDKRVFETPLGRMELLLK